MRESPITSLFEKSLKVVNVGLEGFAEELNLQGVKTVQLDWAPAAGGNRKLADLLSKLGV